MRWVIRALANYEGYPLVFSLYSWGPAPPSLLFLLFTLFDFVSTAPCKTELCTCHGTNRRAQPRIAVEPFAVLGNPGLQSDAPRPCRHQIVKSSSWLPPDAGFTTTRMQMEGRNTTSQTKAVDGCPAMDPQVERCDRMHSSVSSPSPPSHPKRLRT
jgi:hypothetical protein